MNQKSKKMEMPFLGELTSWPHSFPKARAAAGRAGQEEQEPALWAASGAGRAKLNHRSPRGSLPGFQSHTGSWAGSF